MSRCLVLLQSYPRSGNTLVRHVLEGAYGVKTYTIYPNEGEILWPERHVHLGICDHDGLMFVKTHEASSYEGIADKVIYIVRDGRDTLISQAHFLCDFNPSCGDHWHARLAELVEGEDSKFNGRGRSPASHWGEHVKELWPRADARIRFERLLQHPVREVEAALRRIGIADRLPAPKRDSLPDFDDLHKHKPGFYRSGKVGQWVDEFPPDLLERFWELHGDAMELVGYQRGMVPSWA